MAGRKEFISDNRKEIEAELLRLMRDPKCYAIVTQQMYEPFRFRIIKRVSPRKWKSFWTYYSAWHDTTYKLSPSCFSMRPIVAEYIAYQASMRSENEATLIHGEFES